MVRGTWRQTVYSHSFQQVWVTGRVQTWGGPVRQIRAGDTVWIPPNEKHWHGAGPQTGMVHVAMQEALDGKHVTWLEHVTDEQYSAPLAG